MGIISSLWSGRTWREGTAKLEVSKLLTLFKEEDCRFIGHSRTVAQVQILQPSKTRGRLGESSVAQLAHCR